jgi:hypothetical protein
MARQFFSKPRSKAARKAKPDLPRQAAIGLNERENWPGLGAASFGESILIFKSHAAFRLDGFLFDSNSIDGDNFAMKDVTALIVALTGLLGLFPTAINALIKLKKEYSKLEVEPAKNNRLPTVLMGLSLVVILSSQGTIFAQLFSPAHPVTSRDIAQLALSLTNYFSGFFNMYLSFKLAAIQNRRRF